MKTTDLKELKRGLAVAFPNFHGWRKTVDGVRWKFQTNGLIVKGTRGMNHLTVHVGSYETHVGPATPEGLLDIALEIEEKLRTPVTPLTPFGELFLVDPLQRLAALKENL